MKKQINPTIKAHLLRGAFYLLLLVAVCAIPFALAQRNANKRSVAKPKATATMNLANAAAQSGAPASLAGARPAQRKPGTVDSNLPYDLRALPAQAPKFPYSSVRAPGSPGKPFPVSPKISSGPHAVAIPEGVCSAYVTSTSTGTITPGTVDTGNDCDDCTTPITFPFPVSVYGTSYTSALVESNGTLQFTGDTAFFTTGCNPLPNPNYGQTLFPYYDDLRTDDLFVPDCVNFASGCGIFTSVSGTAPNRVFNIEWRTGYFGRTGTANFEVQLSETSTDINVVYGATVDNGLDETSGIQASSSGPATQFSCGKPTLTNGLQVTYSCGAGSPTPTPTATCTPGAGGLLVGSGMTTGFLPNGWGPLLASNTVNYTFANSQAAPNEFAVFETHSPWGSDIVTDAITANGHTFTTFTPPQLAGFAFSDYRVVVLNWDDTFLSDFLSDYTAAIPALEAYINAGGVVWVQAAIQGSPGDNYPMPFGGQGNGADFSDSDPIVDPASPMMTGMPNPIPGTSASHVSYTGLPGGAHIVVINGNDQQPTLYDLRPGGGCGPSPTPTATPTGTPGGCTINGSLDPSDPTQTDRLFRSGVPQTCPTSTTCAILGDGVPRHYDAYTFTNTTGATQCVTVDTTTGCTGGQFIFIGAYLGSFDPNNICNNWIGDAGSSPNPEDAFQFNVDNGQTFIVVVSEVTPGAGCPSYTFTVAPETICGGGVSPTPTATPTCTGGGGGTPGPWMTASPYPSTIVRYGFAQTATHFYVFGGVSDGTRVNAVNRLDLATGMWQGRAPMPFTSEAPTCALMEATGIVYCTEGDTGNGFASYNIATDTWTPLAASPGTDHYGSASGAFNGKVFVAGGFTPGNLVSVYDVASNTWSAGTAAPSTFFLAGYQQMGQFLYVVGGFEPTFANNATTWRLDMSSAPGVWENGPAFTPQRADFGLAYDALTNRLYALGGDLPNDGNPFNSTNLVDELDLSAWPGGTWSSSPPNLLAPNRQANQAGFYGNGDIWSVGGLNGATFQFLNQVLHRTNGGCGGASPTPTATATFTPTPTATFTPTATATATATSTPTATVPPRSTPTPRPRPTPAPRP